MSSNYTIPQEHGILVVFSGPSGAGKGTILKRYFEDNPPAVLSVSATTRPPRPGEVDITYRFRQCLRTFQNVLRSRSRCSKARAKSTNST